MNLTSVMGRIRESSASGLVTVVCLVLGSGGFLLSMTFAPARAEDVPAATSQGHPAAPQAQRAGIDQLIQHLHDSLKITQSQELLWQPVAKVMRENAATLSALAKTRAEHADTANAIDDLRSYVEISEAHADGTRRLLPAFEALYNSMSNEQKQKTDLEFRGHYQAHHRP